MNGTRITNYFLYKSSNIRMHADAKFYDYFLRFFFFFLQLSVRHGRTEQTPLYRTCVLYFSSHPIRPNLHSLFLRRTPLDVPRFRVRSGPRRTCSIPYRARAVDSPPVNIHDVRSAEDKDEIDDRFIWVNGRLQGK